MAREKMKHNGGKFLLTIKTRHGVRYYQESGIFDVGGPNEEPYLYLTEYREYAYGFTAAKSARAMARKLRKERKIYAQIVNREGEVIFNGQKFKDSF